MKEMIFRTSDDGLVMNNASEIELVRCKDCKWNNGYTGCDKYLLPHGGDWFCADGKRKEGVHE